MDANEHYDGMVAAARNQRFTDRSRHVCSRRPSNVERSAPEKAGGHRGVARKSAGGKPDVHDVDELADRRALARLVQQQVEVLQPERARVFSGPGEIACTRMPWPPSS
jgi:hypothetical protein